MDPSLAPEGGWTLSLSLSLELYGYMVCQPRYATKQKTWSRLAVYPSLAPRGGCTLGFSIEIYRVEVPYTPNKMLWQWNVSHNEIGVYVFLHVSNLAPRVKSRPGWLMAPIIVRIFRVYETFYVCVQISRNVVVSFAEGYNDVLNDKI